MDNDNRTFITPSLILEYLYCPRFIYFMEVLKINQNEEKRFKVVKGREIHKIRSLTNVDYKRKKIGVKKKLNEVDIIDSELQLNGKVDEILFLKDGTAAPLDYKFAEYKGKVFKTYKLQSVIYGLLISRQYGVDVKSGYLVFTRLKNHIVKLDFKEKDFAKVKQIVDKIIAIINNGYYPSGTGFKSRCNDCQYRNICVG